jgi:hypothetical protein
MGQAMNPNGHAAISTDPRILIADPDEDNRALYHEFVCQTGFGKNVANPSRTARSRTGG